MRVGEGRKAHAPDERRSEPARDGGLGLFAEGGTAAATGESMRPALIGTTSGPGGGPDVPVRRPPDMRDRMRPIMPT